MNDTRVERGAAKGAGIAPSRISQGASLHPADTIARNRLALIAAGLEHFAALQYALKACYGQPFVCRWLIGPDYGGVILRQQTESALGPGHYVVGPFEVTLGLQPGELAHLMHAPMADMPISDKQLTSVLDALAVHHA
jgi:hypothetical protein